MDRWRFIAVGIAVATLAGCQPGPFDDAAYPRARPLGERLNAYRAPKQVDRTEPHATSLETVEPIGELTLRQAMALAVAQNPELKAYSWDVRRAEALTLQAGLWPNPELEVEFENFAGSKQFSGVDSLETKVSIAQAFPIGGDIERRRDVARYQSQLAGWDYEAARLEVLTDVTQRYINVLTAQRRVQVAVDALQVARQLQATTDKRIDAGDTAPIEAARASVPVATAEVDVRRAERRLKAARKQLALTWGSGDVRFDGLAGVLDDIIADANQFPPQMRFIDCQRVIR